VARSWPKRRSHDWLNHAERGRRSGEKCLQTSPFTGARRRASFYPIRPVTPEVAGSSPVAPVKSLQIGIFCRLSGRKRPPAFRIPRSSRTGSSPSAPLGAANPRTVDDRPHRRASCGSRTNTLRICSDFIRTPDWLPRVSRSHSARRHVAVDADRRTRVPWWVAGSQNVVTGHRDAERTESVRRADRVAVSSVKLS
jgi:hypothetical protein